MWEVQNGAAVRNNGITIEAESEILDLPLSLSESNCVTKVSTHDICQIKIIYSLFSTKYLEVLLSRIGIARHRHVKRQAAKPHRIGTVSS